MAKGCGKIWQGHMDTAVCGRASSESTQALAVGAKGFFFFLFAYFLFLSGDQELISSPISGPQIPHLCNAITLLSCLLPRAIFQHLVFYEG